MSLDRSARQEQVHLVITVPKSLQVLNAPQRRLTVSDCSVHVVLLAETVDAEPFKIYVTTWSEVGLDGPWDVDGRLHVEPGHSLLHDGELDGDHAGHFDGAAEGYLTVALWRRNQHKRYSHGTLLYDRWQAYEKSEDPQR